MIIRRVTALDAKALAQLECTQPLCAQWGEDGWRREVNVASSRIWGAFETDRLVGFVALRLAAGFGEILNVGVCPQFCRQGIGFKLLTHTLHQAQREGAEQISLEVNIHNRAAISLYSKVGFLEVGRREKFYNGTDDALIMELKL